MKLPDWYTIEAKLLEWARGFLPPAWVNPVLHLLAGLIFGLLLGTVASWRIVLAASVGLAIAKEAMDGITGKGQVAPIPLASTILGGAVAAAAWGLL
jgi:glycerol uptake facilitator-like aquaporin